MEELEAAEKAISAMYEGMRLMSVEDSASKEFPLWESLRDCQKAEFARHLIGVAPACSVIMADMKEHYEYERGKLN